MATKKTEADKKEITKKPKTKAATKKETTKTEIKPKKTNKVETKKAIQKLKVPTDFTYGTGKRKTSIAKVWLFKGDGKINVNNTDIKSDPNTPYDDQVIIKPLHLLNLENKYDLKITVLGGGLKSQNTAIQLGVARSIVVLNQEFKSQLKQNGLLTRDSRVKERKKYGRKKARKGFQYRKR